MHRDTIQCDRHPRETELHQSRVIKRLRNSSAQTTRHLSFGNKKEISNAYIWYTLTWDLNNLGSVAF